MKAGVPIIRSRSAAVLTVLAVAGVLAACGNGSANASSASSSTAPATTTSSATPSTSAPADDVYADPASWLCRPENADDACHRDLDTTVVRADGTTEVQPFVPAADPKVDCFYVYPTVSLDPGPNSDLVPSEIERATAEAQVARYSEFCRVFAPMYRQVTLSGIGMGGSDGEKGNWDLAYGDVLAAWQHYLRVDNKGRGVVLVGHSQGTAHLIRLIAEQVDPSRTERKLLVGAVLLGGSVTVAEGKDTGGSFKHVKVCTEDGEYGCVITFSTFDSANPPDGQSLFGRTVDAKQSACTNPAALGSDADVPLDTYISRSAAGVAASRATTPWVSLPGLLHGRCTSAQGVTYLSVTYQRSPSGAWPTDLGGHLGPGWGMHLLDANVAMGDVIARVSEQAAAYVSSR